VHRDLKPANLFLSRRADGSICVKVLDFGISKFASPDVSLSSAADYGMTQAATVLGSPYYMSPEQVRSAKDVDYRTDIWALGVILYELLTGEHPFEGDSLPGLSVAVATEPPRAWPYAKSNVPQAVVDTILCGCLEKDRDRRIQSISELVLRLQPYAPYSAQLSVERILRMNEGVASSSRGGSTRPLLNSVPPTVHSQRTLWDFSQTRRRPGRRHLAYAGLGLAAMLATLLVTLALRSTVPVSGDSSSDARHVAALPRKDDPPHIRVEPQASPPAAETVRPIADEQPTVTTTSKTQARLAKTPASPKPGISTASSASPEPATIVPAAADQKPGDTLGGRL
jgi:serine/threonine-protein kinase